MFNGYSAGVRYPDPIITLLNEDKEDRERVITEYCRSESNIEYWTKHISGQEMENMSRTYIHALIHTRSNHLLRVNTKTNKPLYFDTSEMAISKMLHDVIHESTKNLEYNYQRELVERLLRHG